MLARALGVIALLLMPFAGQAAEQIDFGRYHALVIGNNEYEHLRDLETAVGDATAVAQILKTKYGFKVTLKLNATRRDILSEINRLRATLTEKDRLLVYYAGHGQLDRATGTGYWLPVDAKPEDDTDWIANEALSRHFRGMLAQHVLVVADSCYSGTLLRGSSAAPGVRSERGAWLRRIADTRSRTAFTSGGLEPVADSGSGGHSVFANALLRTLRENDSILDGHSLAKTVAQRVAWNAEQTPQYSDIRMAGHEGGDFILVPVGADLSVTVTVRPADKQPVDERAMELAFWDAIKGSSDAADYEAYLAQYPEGTFASLARNRLKKLKEKRTAAVVAPPKPPTPATPAQPAIGVYQGLKPGDVFRDCPGCPEMVVIPAGSFTMGSPSHEVERKSNEGPQRRVSVRSFAMGKYEVTFAQWDACVAGGGCYGYRPKDRSWGRGKRPAFNVSWKDAKAYITYLTQKTGKRYRLPSEAEWEYGARAGTTTAFHFGPSITPNRANYDGNYTYDGGAKGVYRERTVTVGRFPSNAFGLHDMHGNVWEWVEDCWQESYSGVPVDGSVWTTGGNCNRRVLRGGSWYNIPWFLRSANRDWYDTGYRVNSVGVRVARALGR